MNLSDLTHAQAKFVTLLATKPDGYTIKGLVRRLRRSVQRVRQLQVQCRKHIRVVRGKSTGKAGRPPIRLVARG